MNANISMFESNYPTAESILLRSLEDALPDLWIVSADEELDIRDVAADEEYMLDWHYPGRGSVSNLVPELDFTDAAKAHQALTAKIPRSQLVARGIFAGVQNRASIARE